MNVRYAVTCLWLFLLTTLICTSEANAQVTANFGGTPRTGCAPLVVNFTDSSTGTPNFWRWDLGNGTQSFLQNPSVTYFNPGQYTVRLYVRNAAGTADSIAKTDYINVYALPTVGFTGTPLTGCFPLPVQFTDQSQAGSGTITSWEWDFGDGNISTQQNPSHTYTAGGSYNVSLRVKNSFGCVKSLTKPQYITLTTGVQAAFTNSVPSTCNLPATVDFTNTSTGVGTLSYQWNFGDGGTSTQTSPSHTYTAAGTYTVTLIITNTTGCTDTLVKTNSIVIGSVQASFTSRDTVCVGADLNIQNTSIPAPSTATWDFGDGTTNVGLNPGKSYSAPGTYTIRMIATFGACIDTFYKTVFVRPNATANFSTTDLISCSTPYTVNFTSTAPGAISYLWNFGDGGTSTSANPSHTYTTLGAFTVSLTITNAVGCSTTVTKPNYIRVIKPTITINGLPRRGCAPYNTTFTATVSSLFPVTSYFWEFGDGGTSTAVSPSHTYSSTGTYTVKLKIVSGGCTDSVSIPVAITVSTKPVANFVATPRNVCAYVPVQFTDLTPGPVNQWYWQFGDGATSTEQNPKHEYGDTGYFNVTLIVWNYGCADTIRFDKYIYISPPIARFYSIMDCRKPLERQFRDTSIGAHSWSWQFGDGNTSTLQHPKHTYAAPGRYIVRLTVTNNTTGCTHTRYVRVVVISENPDFTANQTVICKGNSIQFTATNVDINNMISFNWNFGDGASTSTSTLNVGHIYRNAGSYTVRLIARDSLGCEDTIIKPLHIRVDGPTAKFTSNTQGTCLNSNINFNDSSYSDGTHPIVKYIWSYGDGIIDTLTSGPFQHSYAAPGVYTVKLTVIDSKGCIDSLVRPNYIVISKPVADFTSDTASCPQRDVRFTSLSTGPSLTYLWNFGDGNSSTQPNPTHQYAADGLYTVTLSIVDQYGCTDSKIKMNQVNIIQPRPSFLMSDSFSTCPPLIVSFTNTSTGALSKTWDFGDGTSSTLDNPSHFYSSPGVFNVVLRIVGIGGCVETTTKQIIVRGPQGTFTYNNITGCKPLQTSFSARTQDNVSFIWDFNDGTLRSTTDSNVVHTYQNIGSFVPKMILVDAMGCQVPVVGPDTIKVYGVETFIKSNSVVVCDSGFVNFSDSSISNDQITSYAWTFGDGGTSTLQSPSHTYSTNGLYFPRLIVTTANGCSDTAVSSLPVRVISSPQISIAGDTGACVPATLTFLGDVTRPDTSSLAWRWDLGNGNVSTAQNPPPQTYSTAGAYTISAVAVNSSGCTDSVSKTVEAYALPTVDANAGSLVCRGSSTTLSATGAVSYTWSPANSLSCANCPSPVATPDSMTIYTVMGANERGCVATDTVQLAVKQQWNMTVGRGDTVCYGRTARLTASGADSYTWSPSAGLSNSSIADPLARPTVSTNYMVIGRDKEGCFEDTGYVNIRVFPVPTVEAGRDQTISVGGTADLVPTISSDVTNVTWNPTTGIFRNSYPGITVKPMSTTEYTVEVTNRGGCVSKDKVTVFVICNNSNIFVPNSFSPNGDGMNDVFYPRGTGVFRIKNLKIFNRWGEIVFDKNDFMANQERSGWDGTYKGQKLLTDVYVYTLEIICDNNAPLVLKGNVALLQ
jgi:gliding motility-associated-like protein